MYIVDDARDPRFCSHALPDGLLSFRSDDTRRQSVVTAGDGDLCRRAGWRDAQRRGRCGGNGIAAAQSGLADLSDLRLFADGRGRRGATGHRCEAVCSVRAIASSPGSPAIALTCPVPMPRLRAGGPAARRPCLPRRRLQRAPGTRRTAVEIAAIAAEDPSVSRRAPLAECGPTALINDSDPFSLLCSGWLGGSGAALPK
jgi:hypothetical protein